MHDIAGIGSVPQIGSQMTIKTIDNDGLSNQWEMQEFGHINYGPDDDPDGDLLTNIWEYLMGFDPEQAADETERNSDFDSDGYSNYVEAAYGSDPTSPDATPTFQNSQGVEYEYDAIGRIKSITRTN